MAGKVLNTLKVSPSPSWTKLDCQTLFPSVSLMPRTRVEERNLLLVTITSDKCKLTQFSPYLALLV